MRGFLCFWKTVEGLRRFSMSVLLVLVAVALQPAPPPAAAQRVFAPDECLAALNFGVTFECSITVAGEIDAFTILAAAGNRLRVRVVETSGTLSVLHEIVRPNGTTLCGTVTGELSCLLDSSGTHTILVKDFEGSNIGSYSLYIQRLNNPVGCTAIDLGAAPHSGAIDEVAASDCYTFPLGAGDYVRGRLRETTGPSAHQEIVRPDGSTLCGTVVPDLTCQADVTGVYTLLVKDFGGGGLSNYNIYVQNLTYPRNCQVLPYNSAPLEGALTVAAQADCYAFSGFAGRSVRVRAAELSEDFAAFIDVFAPDGTPLCSTIGIETTCVLAADGSYTVLIYDFNGLNTGDYQLSLACLTQPCGPLQLPHIAYLPLARR